jgi:predicted enzyme related to lactoylglutathione lyase
MPALERIGQIAVNVHDLPRAVRFYRDVLGLQHLFDAGPSLSFFDCNGVRLMLSKPERPEYDHPASVLYYKVADLEAVHRALIERRVQFDSPPHLIAAMPTYDLWMAFARDTEGNPFALMAEKPKAS